MCYISVTNNYVIKAKPCYISVINNADNGFARVSPRALNVLRRQTPCYVYKQRKQRLCPWLSQNMGSSFPWDVTVCWERRAKVDWASTVYSYGQSVVLWDVSVQCIIMTSQWCCVMSHQHKNGLGVQSTSVSLSYIVVSLYHTSPCELYETSHCVIVAERSLLLLNWLFLVPLAG